ncbi:MAG: molybdenum cofactor guanylyltransferase, partial [Bdellovibrionota bacterium]
MKTVKVDGSEVMPFAPTLGVILAGGMSTRMGRNKALLPYRGKRLIDHVAQALIELVGAEHFYVSGDLPGFRSVQDVHRGLGPIGGISSIVHQFRDRWILFLPVDMGSMNSETLNLLFEARDAHLGDQAFHFQGYELPLLLYSGDIVREQIAKLLDPRIHRSKRCIKELERALSC